MDEKDVDDIIPRSIENVVPRKIIKVAFEDIVKKLGDSGAKVYLVIDDTSTVGEISKRSKIPLNDVVKILRYLGEKGFVESDIDESTSKLLKERIKRKFEYRDVPRKKDLLSMDMVRLKTLISSKFKDNGMKVYNAIDKKKNITEISEAVKIPTDKVLEILESFKINGFIE